MIFVCYAMKCFKKENKETGDSYVGLGASGVGFGDALWGSERLMWGSEVSYANNRVRRLEMWGLMAADPSHPRRIVPTQDFSDFSVLRTVYYMHKHISRMEKTFRIF